MFDKLKRKIIERELNKMNANDMLQNLPDQAIIKGYQQAMKDYESSKNEQIKMAADIIKKEIDRRGLKVE